MKHPHFLLLSVLLLLACGGSKESANTPVVVTQPPVIQVQPVSQAIWSGAPAVFSVQATGTDLKYQWYRTNQGVDTLLNDGVGPTLMVGLTGLGLHLNQYWVRISNSAATVDSAKAVLTVKEKPSFVVHPKEQVVLEGTVINFTSQAMGTPPLSYQWKRNGTPIPGATSPNYTFTTSLADDDSTFWVEASNVLDGITWAQPSDTAKLKVGTLKVPPKILQHPQNLTLQVGQAGEILVVAEGSEPMAYQWFKDRVAVPGATTARFPFTAAAAEQAGTYHVTVTNVVNSVSSQPAIVTVQAIPPRITQGPANAVVGTGQTATFTVQATGSAPLSFQWFRNGIQIAGATEAAYVTPVLTVNDDNSMFTVRVSNSASSVLSNAAELRVYQARTVSGVCGTFQETSTGEIWTPTDLSDAKVEAYIADGVGGFQRYAGVGNASGEFEIPGVPPGVFALWLAPQDLPGIGISGTGEYVDLRAYQAGRSGAVITDNPLTRMSITLQGPSAARYNGVAVLVPNVAVATSLSDAGPLFRIPWQGLPLVKAPDDKVMVAALETTDRPGGDKLTRTSWVTELAPFNQNPGSDYKLSLSPDPQADDHSIDIAVNLDEYATLRGWIHPAATALEAKGPLEVTVGAHAYEAAPGVVPPLVPILRYQFNQTGAVAVSAIPYPDPFPEAWLRRVHIKQHVAFSLPVPGRSTPVQIADGLEEYWHMEGWKSSSHVPQVQPVDEPRINGVNLFQPPASVGTEPALTWKLRAGQHPAYFEIDLFEVTDDSTLLPAARFVCEGNSFTLPKGCLASGKLYVIRIVAVRELTYQTGQPFRREAPRHTAPVYSSVFKP